MGRRGYAFRTGARGEGSSFRGRKLCRGNAHGKASDTANTVDTKSSSRSEPRDRSKSIDEEGEHTTWDAERG
jgi:hypothetical protein